MNTIPKPNETVSGLSLGNFRVIASVVLNDDDPKQVRGLVLGLTENVGSYYALIETTDGVPEFVLGTYPNIVPAVEAYQENGGDY